MVVFVWVVFLLYMCPFVCACAQCICVVQKLSFRTLHYMNTAFPKAYWCNVLPLNSVKAMMTKNNIFCSLIPLVKHLDADSKRLTQTTAQ